jgi:hypothetical protein
MRRVAVACAFCALVAGALVARAVTQPDGSRAVAAAPVSPFEMMVKAGKLPVESFDTV